MRIRQGRLITPKGGYGMEIRLPEMRTNDQVYWSKGGSSYVVDAHQNIWSINGIGEIRWKVEPWNTDPDSNAAREYFLEDEDGLQRDGIYEVGGYEIAAQINVFEGGGPPHRQVVTVFHNNSTHYIVGWMETSDNLEFVFVKSYRYGDTTRPNYKDAYSAALALAVELAQEN